MFNLRSICTVYYPVPLPLYVPVPVPVPGIWVQGPSIYKTAIVTDVCTVYFIRLMTVRKKEVSLEERIIEVGVEDERRKEKKGEGKSLNN